jgi:hypothetical protein
MSHAHAGQGAALARCSNDMARYELLGAVLATCPAAPYRTVLDDLPGLLPVVHTVRGSRYVHVCVRACVRACVLRESADVWVLLPGNVCGVFRRCTFADQLLPLHTAPPTTDNKERLATRFGSAAARLPHVPQLPD